jgi:sialate O-acetylesterase
MFKPLIAAVVLALFACGAPAQLAVPPIFSQGMVLQAGDRAAVWGTATVGDVVQVEFAGQLKRATTGRNGAWRVDLGPLKPSAAGTMIVRSGQQLITIDDVLVGEVWFVAGQSNMEAYLYKLPDAAAAMANPSPQVRMFLVEKEALPKLANQLNGRWVKASPKPLGLFSAVGYLFGAELNRTLKQPVGLIQSTWGGTRIDAWMSAESLSADPRFAERVQKGEALDDGIDSLATFKARMTAWNADHQLKKPNEPCFMPSRVYNAMVGPLMPYSMRGVLWYQGESDAYTAAEYQLLFPAMITDWRRGLEQPKLPFLFVQLPNYNKRVDHQPKRSFWAEAREAQLAALELPNTGMIVTIDIGEEDIHPKNKKDVADRLLKLALAEVYGQKTIYKAPSFQSMRVEGGKVRIAFKDAKLGLKTRDGQPPIGFAIAGEDQKFVWAKAQIDGETIILWSDEVKSPVAVRYAYQENPAINLVSNDGLPVGPFRTDKW